MYTFTSKFTFTTSTEKVSTSYSILVFTASINNHETEPTRPSLVLRRGCQIIATLHVIIVNINDNDRQQSRLVLHPDSH